MTCKQYFSYTKACWMDKKTMPTFTKYSSSKTVNIETISVSMLGDPLHQCTPFKQNTVRIHIYLFSHFDNENRLQKKKNINGKFFIHQSLATFRRIYTVFLWIYTIDLIVLIQFPLISLAQTFHPKVRLLNRTNKHYQAISIFNSIVHGAQCTVNIYSKPETINKQADWKCHCLHK